jgi:hypothetical protein
MSLTISRALRPARSLRTRLFSQWSPRAPISIRSSSHPATLPPDQVRRIDWVIGSATVHLDYVETYKLPLPLLHWGSGRTLTDQQISRQFSFLWLGSPIIPVLCPVWLLPNWSLAQVSTSSNGSFPALLLTLHKHSEFTGAFAKLSFFELIGVRECTKRWS